MASGLLKEVGVTSSICAGLAELERSIDDRIWFAVMTEEAARTDNLRALVPRLKSQPTWSDLPFIVLTKHGGGVERNPAAARLLDILGNVSFLERPFHPATFVSLAKSAVRARQRQYDARTRMEELRFLNETLEERVAERTAEIERAHETVLSEIAQRERTEELLRQSQKMEMIGQLTGGIAHDFNNLLMAVLGNLDLLRKHIPTDPRTTRLIDSASQGAQRGAALTQRLLAFARRQDLQVRPVDIVALVRGMTDLLERSIGSGIELLLDFHPGLPPALIDSNQVELALLNLAVNARDAMPNGGTLSVKAEAVSAPPGGGLKAGGYIRLSVADTGVGMNPETMSKATEPFFSTKEVGKGTGLGLSMVHGLAVQLDGMLRLSSEEGKGTVAELWLPATDLAATSRDQDGHPSVEEDSTLRMKILVVDDDALIAMSTVDMLEDLGHEVLGVDSGQRALEILGNGESFDLMITDYAMPKMTGAQLACKVRELRPNMPVLLATGYAERPMETQVDLPRLSKPYQQAELAAEIRRVVKSR